VTPSRDAQGLGLAADAVRYLRALLRRSVRPLDHIPFQHFVDNEKYIHILFKPKIIPEITIQLILTQNYK